MDDPERLAYLAGVIDGDGYLKIMKGRSRQRANYQIQIGIQQLWPGEAIRLFAETFSGKMMRPMVWLGHRTVARCELPGRTAAVALTRLYPYLLVKREQAGLLLELQRLKAQPKTGRFPYSFVNRRGLRITRSRPCFGAEELASMERLWTRLRALHEGDTAYIAQPEGARAPKGDPESSWTHSETVAYLAGIMDSDGSFRVEKRRVKGMLTSHYRISIRAAQVVPSPAIELLARTFGVRTAIRKSKRLEHRDLVCWSVFDGTAAEAVAALLPYLIVKPKEALLLLELRRLKAEGKKGTTIWMHRARGRYPVPMPKRCYTPDQVADFERIHRAVQALHQGSAADVTPRQDA